MQISCTLIIILIWSGLARYRNTVIVLSDLFYGVRVSWKFNRLYVSKGFPEKEDEYIRDIDRRGDLLWELAQAIMEAEKSHDCLQAGEPRKLACKSIKGKGLRTRGQLV